MPLLEARVKSVLSGDTVVLAHVSNPAQERILSLAYVSAPRLKREGDEVSAHFSPRGCFYRCYTCSIYTPLLHMDLLAYSIPFP